MMKTILTAALVTALSFLSLAPRASAAAGDVNRFDLVGAIGVAQCLPNAHGSVTIHDSGQVQDMHVEVFDLPANTQFTVFLIQVPKAPFGMVWYQGDILTNKHGRGVGDFRGIFSKETFINGPGFAPAPVVFADNASINPPTAPIQIYHMGLWFADLADAQNATCAAALTPFDGDHQGGVQVLNTSNFPDGQGPLANLQ